MVELKAEDSEHCFRIGSSQIIVDLAYKYFKASDSLLDADILDCLSGL